MLNSKSPEKWLIRSILEEMLDPKPAPKGWNVTKQLVRVNLKKMLPSTTEEKLINAKININLFIFIWY